MAALVAAVLLGLPGSEGILERVLPASGGALSGGLNEQRSGQRPPDETPGRPEADAAQ